jgi:lipoate---protein ligase
LTSNSEDNSNSGRRRNISNSSTEYDATAQQSDLLKKLHYVHKSTKLIHISLEYTKSPTQDHTISSIKITGDFFVYPEESLDTLEADLVGTKLDRYPVRQKISQWLEGSQVFGFDSDSLTEAIIGCFHSGEDNHEI